MVTYIKFLNSNPGVWERFREVSSEKFRREEHFLNGHRIGIQGPGPASRIQGAQDGLIKVYSLNYIEIYNMVQGIFLH